MTDRSAICQSLILMLQQDTAADVSAIDDATELRGGLALDSVDFVGLVMRIEGEYRIRFTREELEGLATVGDILNLIQAKIKAIVPDTITAAA